MDITTMEGVSLGVWSLMGIILVFFMQAGFAMVETGFTRAKNAGNIIMKNVTDFCLGTIAFMLIGYSLMYSKAYFSGWVGVPDFTILNDFDSFLSSGECAKFVFGVMFCATAATIVSGAMAERTRFSAYCIYSIVISAVVFPIEAGWVWNHQGWLYKLGYTDFAGSSCIHMVGGLTALIGIMFLGPRTDKFYKDEKGKTIVNAIPGHSIPLAALGVFILWFGWYGFNGAAADSTLELGRIFLTTTIAPAAATISCMIYTWWKLGKPDVPMCLNAAIGGLVSVTAGCAYVNATGALVIGAIAGIIVVEGTNLLESKAHLDDPVGAVAVHGFNGAWGAIAVGLFDTELGLFTKGAFALLLVQLLGTLAIACFTGATMTLTFYLIKRYVGIRSSKEDEIVGLDVAEHGLGSAYADFQMTAPIHTVEGEFDLDLDDLEPIALTDENKEKGQKYTKITVICSEEKFGVLKDVMAVIGVTGMTVSNVVGCGTQRGRSGKYRGVRMSMNLLPKVKVEIIVSTVDPGLVVAAAKKALYTGKVGDGKIFVSDVSEVMRVRTGSMGVKALNDEEYTI